MGKRPFALAFGSILSSALPCACVAPPRASLSSGSDAAPGEEEGRPSESGREPFTFDGFWIAGSDVRADKDHNEPSLGLVFDADIENGRGWGVRAGYGALDPTNVGLLYQTTSHDEADTDTRVTTHALYAEVLASLHIPSDSFVQALLAAGFGVGGAIIDFERYYDDTGGAAIQGRLLAGVTIGSVLDIYAGGGGFLWGYPSETMGYGSFVLLGGGVRF